MWATAWEPARRRIVTYLRDSDLAGATAAATWIAVVAASAVTPVAPAMVILACDGATLLRSRPAKRGAAAGARRGELAPKAALVWSPGTTFSHVMTLPVVATMDIDMGYCRAAAARNECAGAAEPSPSLL